MSSPRPSPPDAGVIVAAAGRGTRIGGEPKQFRTVGDMPILLRAIRPFLSPPAVISVVVVLPASAAAQPPGWLQALRDDRLRIVAGGEQRADSVRAGLAALPPEVRRVLVHDGARPFPDPEVIDAILRLTAEGHAAIAAIPVHDTVKESRLGPEGRAEVSRTVARERLWRAQTPQGFPRPVLERAYAAQDGIPASDDAELVERLGESVQIVPDTTLNVKVTSVQDLALAEAIAATRG